MATKVESEWTADLIPDQSSRRVVITGANSGLGFETAVALAKKGAEIILPARSLAKSEEAAARIRRRVGNVSVVPAVIDLATQGSVLAFVAWFERHFTDPSFDLLINNAGVMAIPKRQITSDGFERQFATNFLGHFSLTASLYPYLKQKRNTRVVFVSSLITKWAKLDFNNLQSERTYRPFEQAYAQSKLALALFAFEFQRRLQSVGSPVEVTSAHPGYAITNLQTSGPGDSITWHRLASLMLKPLASQSAAQGALPILFAATAPQAIHGGYYGPSGPFELRGPPSVVPIPRQARNSALSEDLWLRAQELTRIIFNVM